MGTKTRRVEVPTRGLCPSTPRWQWTPGAGVGGAPPPALLPSFRKGQKPALVEEDSATVPCGTVTAPAWEGLCLQESSLEEPALSFSAVPCLCMRGTAPAASLGAGQTPPNCSVLKSTMAFVGLCLQSDAKGSAARRTGEQRRRRMVFSCNTSEKQHDLGKLGNMSG